MGRTRAEQEVAEAAENRRLQREFRGQVTRWSKAQIAAHYTPERVADLLAKADRNRAVGLRESIEAGAIGCYPPRVFGVPGMGIEK